MVGTDTRANATHLRDFEARGNGSVLRAPKNTGALERSAQGARRPSRSPGTARNRSCRLSSARASTQAHAPHGSGTAPPAALRVMWSLPARLNDHVFRPDAPMIATSMPQESARRAAVGELPSVSIGGDHLAADGKLPDPVRADARSPHPTGWGLMNLPPEAIAVAIGSHCLFSALVCWRPCQPLAEPNDPGRR